MYLLDFKVTRQVHVLILFTSSPSNYWLSRYTRHFTGLIKYMIPATNTHSNTWNTEANIYRKPVSSSIPKEKSHEFTLTWGRTAHTAPSVPTADGQRAERQCWADSAQGKAMHFPDYVWCLFPLFLGSSSPWCPVLYLGPGSPLLQPLYSLTHATSHPLPSALPLKTSLR